MTTMAVKDDMWVNTGCIFHRKFLRCLLHSRRQFVLQLPLPLDHKFDQRPLWYILGGSHNYYGSHFPKGTQAEKIGQLIVDQDSI